jgi:hypothetical protein
MRQYLTSDEVIAVKRTQPPAFYSVSGYGRKIPTRYLVQLADKRWRRVYVCQISNAGTAYILVGNDWRVVSGDTEDTIEKLCV